MCMYSWEIQKLLELRNYLLNSEEYLNVCNTSPQINRISYNGYEDNFNMTTKDNYHFKFKVKRLEENKNREG